MKNKIFICFTFCMFSILPYTSFGQAPNLGTAINFSLFTSVGAFDNLGPTFIIGDIGTNAGAFTGFPPGTLVGSSYVADPTSLQAVNDIDIAYNSLVALACDTVIGPLLGGGQTLPPKVYCITTASSLAGDLILDGQGDPNALFIFKIDGAFSTSTFSNVLLIDSAKWCNVYWQINGAFILGDNSVFRGTMINNGAISLLEGSNIIGRGLSKAGAIDLHNNKVTNICSSLSPMPMELVSFSANCSDKKTVIKWSTSTETNNEFFSIERSIDGIEWQTAGILNGSGNSNILIDYSFTDAEPYKDVSYYRLRQTDFDGTFKHSHIVSYTNCSQNPGELYIYPNPSSGLLNLLIEGDRDMVSSVSISNTIGTSIYNSHNFQTNIDLSDQPDGIYFISIKMKSQEISQKLVIKK